MEVDAPKELLGPLGSASVDARLAGQRHVVAVADARRRKGETLVSSSSADTLTSVVSDNGIEIRDGYAEVGDVRLHYVEAGDGPLIVLLHGFPEFWYGWRLQIEPLAAAGFR